MFQMGCAGMLDPRPFLEFEFRTGIYLLDQDGDGCTDGAGLLDSAEIDPVEFLPALPVARRSCPPITGDGASRHAAGQITGRRQVSGY